VTKEKGIGAGLRAYRRTALAILLVVGAGGVTGWLGAPGAVADPSSSGSSSWVPGDADATAQAITVHPSTAGLGYDVTLATSVADYQAALAQAESQTFNGGALVLAATTTQCNGSPPVVSQSQLPQPVVVESNNGDASQTKTLNSGYNGSGPGAGVEQASATTQPQAAATTKLADFAVPGGLDVSGSQSSALAQQVSGAVRQATSSADVGQVTLAGGLVSLNGLHWQSTQETGAGGAITHATGTFSLGSVTVAGVTTPVSADNVAAVLAAADTALSPTGFHIGPVPTMSENSADGTVSVPPLAIGIDSSALGAQVVGPLLGAGDTLRQALDQALLGVTCQLGIPLTVRDIALGALAGGGGIDLELGGVVDDSNGTAYANPFDNTLGQGGGAVSLGAPGTPGGAGTASFTPGSAGVAGTAGTAPASPGATGTSGGRSGSTPGALGGITRALRCITTSPFGHPGCSGGGAAVPVGLAGLVTVLAMGSADLLRQRRVRALSPSRRTGRDAP
jgi:hypothetical protein